MKNKTKLKQAANGSEHKSTAKRKAMIKEDPPAKRQKDDKWFPGKFVLLKQPNESPQKSNDDQASTSQQVSKENGGSHQKPSKANGKSKKKKKKELELEEVYDEALSESDDDSWDDLADDESLSDEDGDSAEWFTDTDYSEGDSFDDDEHSFHESDCESVDDNEGNCWEDGSTDDSDYVPDIEDKYVKSGDAIIYDAKGLELAFGNSTDSQIIEISDINPALMEKSDDDDDVPDLVPFGSAEEVEEKPKQSNEQETFDDDDDDVLALACSQLAGCAAFYDCTDERGIVVKLSSTIHFHGLLIVRPIANSVQVNGYTVQHCETVTATSIARADYFLNLTPVLSSNYSKDETRKELQALLSCQDATDVISSFDPQTEALIHLQHGLPDASLEMLKAYSPHPILPSKKMILTNSPCPRAELILSAKFFVADENRKVSAFQLNEQWNHVEVTSNSRLMVVGGKNVGKSGLSVFLINRNVERFKKILLIDLDIGQPVCGPAQAVSATLITKPIVGPGYLSQNPPDKCLLYGDKSVMIAPFKYVRCVRQLMKFCVDNPKYANVPWVFNTLGYQKGFGLQLMCLLIRILQPTDVVQIQHGIKSYNFSQILTEKVVSGFEFNFFDADDVAGIPTDAAFTTHILDSIVNNSGSDAGPRWISNATDKRKLSMLAQLAKLLDANQTSLNDVTPFVAPISKIRMLVTDEEYAQQDQALNMDLLNGNLVYLCRSEDSEPLTADSIVECFGVGIVRGIDTINEKLYILLPQPDELLTKINVLAIGNIPLPAEILLKQNVSIAGSIPYVTVLKDRNTSSQKFVNKRNIKDCY